MESNQFSTAVSNHFQQLVSNYQVIEDFVGNAFEYTFQNKQSGQAYIRLLFSENDPHIEIRLLEMKAVCLVKTTPKQSLSDFIHLSVEELIACISYIDLPGQPAFYFSSKISNAAGSPFFRTRSF